jgi:hypothetical protein
MATIYSIQGKPILVDDDDASWLSRYRWTVGDKGYATTGIRTTKGQRTRSMHRFIMDPPAHLLVDHINHIRTDNRRHNLRLATRKENQNNLLGQRRFVTDLVTGKFWLCRGYELIGIYDSYAEQHQAWIEAEHGGTPRVTNTAIPID